MTPAERARMIDKQEFEAECRAVRDRALARLGIKQAKERARVQCAIAIPVRPGHFMTPIDGQPPKPKRTKRPRSQQGQLYTIAGRSLTRRQWAEELGINPNAMSQAVHNHGSVEAVVLRRLGGNDK